MKILFVNKNLGLGGGERLITNLAKYSTKDGSIIFDFALIENHVDFSDLSNLNIIPLTNAVSIEGIKRLFYLPVILFKLVAMARHYDYLVSFERAPAYLCLLVGLMVNKPRIIYVINPLSASFSLIYKNSLTRNLHVWFHKVVFCRAVLILAMSERIRRELVDTYFISPAKINTLYPSIDTKHIKSLMRQPLSEHEEKIFAGKKVMITVGRLHKQKNQIALVRAFNAIAKQLPKLNLVIVGEGPERRNLEKLIQSFRLEGRVVLLGGKNNPYKYLARSKIFALSSFFEGVPSVILEAMYCRVSVVAVDSPFGLREILTPELDNSQKLDQVRIGKFGMIVPNDKSKIVSGLAQGISMLLKNSGVISTVKTDAADWSRNFTVQKVFKKWKGILEKDFLYANP